jgi:hypothetical protein
VEDKGMKKGLKIPKNANVLILEPNEEVRFSFVRYLSKHVKDVFVYPSFESVMSDEMLLSNVDFLISEIFDGEFQQFLSVFKDKNKKAKIVVVTTKENELANFFTQLADYIFFKPIAAAELFEDA